MFSSLDDRLKAFKSDFIGELRCKQGGELKNE